QVSKLLKKQSNKKINNQLTNQLQLAYQRSDLISQSLSEKRKSTKQSIFSKFLALSIDKLSFYYKSSVKLVIFLHYAIPVPKSFAPYAPILLSLQIQEQIMNQENKFGGERIVKKDCCFCQYVRLFLKEQVTQYVISKQVIKKAIQQKNKQLTNQLQLAYQRSDLISQSLSEK
ncbi:hypothetical protein TTHERM_02562200, partial (macronuclear) [Tetrahymena thermophila SB210]